MSVRCSERQFTGRTLALRVLGEVPRPGLGVLPERQLPSQHRAWYSARAGQAEERKKQNRGRKYRLLAEVSDPAVSTSYRTPLR